VILLSSLLANALVAPDAAPLSEAVSRCDRPAVAAHAQAEPIRRAEFAMGVYAEQRAIAAERAALDAATPTVVSGPAGGASLTAARDALDARQRRLDDAVRVERAWREVNDELRAQFLAACTGRKANNG
jgi:hypothetical protein